MLTKIGNLIRRSVLGCAPRPARNKVVPVFMILVASVVFFRVPQRVIGVAKAGIPNTVLVDVAADDGCELNSDEGEENELHDGKYLQQPNAKRVNETQANG